MNAGSNRIGPYEVVGRLGEGGMAETFIALRRGPGGFEQRVCLKRIRPDHQGDPDFVRQFLSEARIAASLRHANIAQVLDFGSEGETYYLVLELVEGMDLRGLLERAGGRLDPELVLYLATELATALDVAHRGTATGQRADAAAVVHRDVSPSNVLLSPAGEVKLTDFGIARATSGPQYTRTGIVKGKVPYLAPEYARSGQFDARCDLFSLGILLFEALAGRRPYDGATDLQTLERASRGERPSLAELAPSAPPVFRQAIEQLIEPDPQLRLQSASELLDLLAALPPAPRARRTLGSLVESLAAAQAPAFSPTASAGASGERTEALDPPEPSRAASLSARLPGRRRLGPRVALAVASLTALAALALGMLRGAPASEETAPEALVRGEPLPAAEHTAAEGEEALLRQGEPAPESHDAMASARSPRSAQLEVVVVPFGDVYVDGNLRGAAPVTLQLPPGTHSIRTDGPASRKELVVSLRPGERRRVELQ